MIRRFIQCKNTKERLNLMAASNETEWAEGELDTVMEIFGLKVPEGASKTEKWALILLSLTNKEAADEAALSQKVFQDVEEVKTYPFLENDRIFMLCWNFQNSGVLSATMCPSPKPFYTNLSFKTTSLYPIFLI